MDVVLAFPALLLAIAIVTVLGRGLLERAAGGRDRRRSRSTRASCARPSCRSRRWTSSPPVGRSANRAAARCVRRILPNSMTPLIVAGTLGIATAVLEVAALSFLGLGPPPQEPEWGNMIGREFNGIFTRPLIVLAPGFALTDDRPGLQPHRRRPARRARPEAQPLSAADGRRAPPRRPGLTTSFATRAGVVRAVTGVDFHVARGRGAWGSSASRAAASR